MIKYNFSNFKIEPSAFTYHQNGKMIGFPEITPKLQYSDFQKYFERPVIQMVHPQFESGNQNMDMIENSIRLYPEKIGSSKKRKKKTHGLVRRFKKLNSGRFFK